MQCSSSVERTSSPIERKGVLLFSQTEKTRASLSAILVDSGWAVYTASSLREAVALLRKNDIPVAIADGGWREILDAAGSRPNPPSVIVTAPFADEALWAEVLNLGGFDVLAQPFDANEVSRIAQAALRRSQMPAHHTFGLAQLAAAI